MDFEYKIIYENRVLIVTLKGDIALASRDRLDTCIQEVISFRPNLSILVMKGVTSIDLPLYRELTILQKELRGKSQSFLVAGLATKLRADMIEKAVVRAGELRPSLETALKSLTGDF